MNVVVISPRPLPRPRRVSVRCGSHRPPVYISPSQLHKSAEYVHLVCGFYGPDHPYCKKAVDDDADMYIDFMKQFKMDDDDTSEK